MTDANIDELRKRIIAVLRQIHDPEIPVNIYDLGLVYDLDVTAEGHVRVRMTLTSPNCPVAEALPGYVETAIRGLEGVGDVDVELVWEPPWSLDRMSEAAQLELGLSNAPAGRQPFVSADSFFRKEQ